MFELFLRLQHQCPYNELSKKYPDARISTWCNSSADILEIEATNLETFEGIQKELTAMSKEYSAKILSKSMTQGRVQLIAKTCSCNVMIKTPTDEIFAKYDFMEVPPDVITGGWEHYRLVGFENSDLRGLLRHLDSVGKAEVLYKKTIPEGVTDDTFVVSLSSLFGALTDKQLKALVTAIEGGYYEIPKKVTTEDLAKRQRQPRTTYEEHIRKAESKLVHAVAPFMMMYAKVPGNPLAVKTRAAGSPMGARIMRQMAVIPPASSRGHR